MRLKKLKSWNWGAFGFILLLAILGTLSNEKNSIENALILGIIIGGIIGLIFAYLGRN